MSESTHTPPTPADSEAVRKLIADGMSAQDALKAVLAATTADWHWLSPPQASFQEPRSKQAPVRGKGGQS